VQKKTFQKWVNSHLVRVGNRIGDLYTDLRDGKMLLKLLEVLSGERLVNDRFIDFSFVLQRMNNTGRQKKRWFQKKNSYWNC